MNRPKVIVPVPVSVMVDPARSTHPVSIHRDRPRARGVLRPRQLPAARRVNPPKMVPEPVSVMVVSVPASARGHRGRPTIRSQDSPAPARSTSTVHPPARPAHQDSPPPAEGTSTPAKATPARLTPAKATPAKATPAPAPKARANPARLNPARLNPARLNPARARVRADVHHHRRLAKPSGEVATFRR